MGATQKVDFTITAQDMFTAVMNGVVAGMTKAKQSMEQFGPTAQKAADQFSQAFKTLNIRSAFDIKAEQNRLIDAFNQIKNSGKASAEEVARAQTAMQSKLKDLQAELSNTAAASEKSGASLGAVFKVAGMGSFYFNNIKTAVENAWQALMNVSGPAMEMTRLNAMFKASSGSAELAAKDLAYVRAESNRLGLSFLDVAGSFAKFNAASRNTSLEGQKVKEVFTAVSEAVTALQLPVDATDRIMVQLQQMMSKNKVTAQDLRVVAESLPGTYEAVAAGLGMTTGEMQKQMEAGNLLASDVLPKLAKHLHDLYGAAALDAANSPAAQMNRLKTATFELMAVLGQKPMQVIGDVSGALAGLANAAKAALDWMAHDAWGQSLSSLAAGLGFVATALTVAAGAQAIYAAATWAATTATGAFTVSLLANPLVLAFGAAVVGVVAALSALANAFDNTGKSASGSSKGMQQSTESARKAAADHKQIEDDYTKAMGESTDRQLVKRKEQLDKDTKAVEAKYSLDLKNVEAGSDAEKKLTEKMLEDKHKLQDSYYSDIDKIRKGDLTKQEAEATAEVKNRIDLLRKLGNNKEADSLDASIKNRAEIKEVEDYYKGIEDAAKANGKVLIGIEQEKADAIDRVKKLQALKGAQRNYEEGQKELQAYKGIMDSKAALLTAAAGTDVQAQRRAQVMIESMEIDYNRRRYQAAAAHFQDVAALYPKDTDQYRAALNDMTAAHKNYLDSSTAAYKKYADEIKRIDQDIKSFREGIQSKIRDIQQKGMTDDQKYADNQLRYQELVSKSRQSLLEGDTEAAKKYAQQAEDYAAKAADKTTSSNDELVKQQVLKEGIADATGKLNELEALGVEIRQKERQQYQDSLDTLKKPLDPKNIVINMDQASLAQVKSELDALIAPATKVVNVVYRSTGSSGEASFSDTPATGFFTGGKVANGSMLRDSVNAMLAKGEWVINNRASSFWGDDLLAAVNSPFSAAGRSLQQMLSFTLPAPAAATAGDVPKMGSVDLNIAGFGSFPIQTTRDVLSELTTAVRRMQMRRPQ